MVAEKVFDGVNISIPRKVIEKFDSRAGLDAILEGGPWMIRNSPIILKKWSMNTSLQKEELTRIPIWFKFHDVPIQVFEEDGISLIATYLGKLVTPRRLSELNMNRSRLDVPLAIYLDTRKFVNRKHHYKGVSAGNKLPKGVPVSKGFDVGKEFAFQPKASNVGSNGNNGTRDDAPLITKGTNISKIWVGKKITNIASPNSFAALRVDDDDEEEIENI
nr:zinc knuckle CX2CX4HX4C [Tanacetum cinerariifolium]